MKNKKVLVGISSILAVLSSFALTAKMIATSSSDYKGMVNDILGGSGSFSGGQTDAYTFNSEFKNSNDVYKKRAEIAAQLSEEGCVLLKNKNNVLPLKDESSRNVTVLGSVAFTYNENGGLRDSRLGFYGGIVGSKVYQQNLKVDGKTLSLPITLEKAFEEEKINVNPDCIKVYSNKNFPSEIDGSEANGSSSKAFNSNEPHVEATDFPNRDKYSDACFVVIGRHSGEGREYIAGPNGLGHSDGAKSALSLNDEEKNLIKEAHKISNKVIVLLNSAVAMEISDLKDGNEIGDLVDSILWIGLPGAYGMRGIARVINGSVAPSGHLSDTYAVDASSSPAAQNFGVSAQDNSGYFQWSNPGYYTNADNYHYVALAEDIYTGYYYYETRYADCVENKGNARKPVGLGYGATNVSEWNYESEMAYPFGYGLSYTTFKQEFVANSNGDLIKYDKDNDKLYMNVKVTNTGNYKGKDVVQLYMQSPYTSYDIEHKVEKSAIQLVTFDKTKELDIGESEVITLSVDLKYMASYDKTATHDNKVGGYILEDADYYFAIGNGAHEALNNVLLNKDGIEESNLFIEENSQVSKENAKTWNPAKEKDLTDKEKGKFQNGINATLLNTNEEGYVIENQLSDADYNYFKKDTITYLSRNDWAGTFPKAYVGLEVTEAMTKYLGTSATNSSNVYTIKSGGTLKVEFDVDHSMENDENGNPKENKVIAEYKGFAYDDESWDYLLEQITFDEAWKFSPYGGRSCKAFKSVNAPEVWQIDGPNGNVTRTVGKYSSKNGPMAMSSSDDYYNYMTADMPCEPTIAATFNKELLEEEGESFGEDSLWSNNCIAWAPGMNLHRTPFNSRNHEYYSEDPMLTNICGTAFVRGGVKEGAILSAKHFAFNTQESFREGLTQFMEEQSARELELRAFQGITQDVKYINFKGNEVNALGLMTSFSRIGVCGVNAHTGLMKNILRGEWGFKGLSSTDMVVGGRYFNPQDSIINNVTFMATSNAENLLSNYWPEYNNKNKVKSDANLVNAMYENMHYYMYALANSNALNGYDANTVIVDDQVTWWEKTLTGISIGTGASALILLGIYEYVFNLKPIIVNKKEETK